MDEASYKYPVTDYSFRKRLWTLVTSGDWIARIVIESFLIVMSILSALAVDAWRDGRKDQRLAHEALIAFESEISQNKGRLEDSGPYLAGLRSVIERMRESGEISSADQFYDQVPLEDLRPPFLTNTVWETSLTTGAIPHIDFAIVNALSYTYSLQQRLSDFSRTGMPTLARGSSVPDGRIDAALREVVVYLGDLSKSEADLLAAYDEVLKILHAAERERGDSLHVDSARAVLDGGRAPARLQGSAAAASACTPHGSTFATSGAAPGAASAAPTLTPATRASAFSARSDDAVAITLSDRTTGSPAASERTCSAAPSARARISRSASVSAPGAAPSPFAAAASAA